MPKPSEDTLLYHMTHLENMPSILQHGLFSRKRVQLLKLDFEDIADSEILAGRENFRHLYTLSEYVPFHFFPKNPFDYAVCHAHGSKNMAIITISRTLAETYNLPVITAHPLNPSAKWYDSYREGLKNIDWKTLDSDYPYRDYSDNNIKQKCMAECLAFDRVPSQYFTEIYVYDDEAKQKIDICPKFPCSRFIIDKDCPASPCQPYWSRIRSCPIKIAPYMFP